MVRLSASLLSAKFQSCVAHEGGWSADVLLGEMSVECELTRCVGLKATVVTDGDGLAVNVELSTEKESGGVAE